MISVCIATFNGEKYVKTQLDSILNQLGNNDEIIISDDGSTDNTIEIIKSINDQRIRVFPHNNFKSPIYNFENAIKQANGVYIFLSDQDDLWLPNKVSIMLKSLEENDVVVSNCFVGDDNLNVFIDSFFKWKKSRRGFVKNFYKNSYLGCCMAFNRKVLDVVLPFPKNIAMHDIWIGLISEFYYKISFIDDQLIIYRRHSNNTTKLTKKNKSTLNFLFRVKYRFIFLLAIFKRLLKRNFFLDLFQRNSL